MQPEWRKALYKAADLVVLLPIGHPAWPKTMFEPLTIAFILPFLPHRPWQLRRSQHILELGRELSCMWRDNQAGEGPILQKLWSLQRRLVKMPEELARKMLYGQPSTDVPNSYSRKRRGSSMAKEVRGASFPKRKKGRYAKRTFPM